MCDAVDFFACSSIDDVLVWRIVDAGSHNNQILCEAKSDVWFNDISFNASNIFLLAIIGAAIDDLIDDDHCEGDVNIKPCLIIKLE